MDREMRIEDGYCETASTKYVEKGFAVPVSLFLSWRKIRHAGKQIIEGDYDGEKRRKKTLHKKILAGVSAACAENADILLADRPIGHDEYLRGSDFDFLVPVGLV